MRKLRRLLVAALIGAAIGTPIASILAAENALHIWDRRPADPRSAAALVNATGAVRDSVQVTAADGTRLDAWIFTPRQPNGAGAILLHGVGDSRTGVLDFAEFL